MLQTATDMSPMKDSANLYPSEGGEKTEPVNQFTRHDRVDSQNKGATTAPGTNPQNYAETASIIKRAAGKETPSPLQSAIRPPLFKQTTAEPEKEPAGEQAGKESVPRSPDEDASPEQGQDEGKKGAPAAAGGEEIAESPAGQAQVSYQGPKSNGSKELKQKLASNRRQTVEAKPAKDKEGRKEAEEPGKPEKGVPASLYENKPYIKKSALKFKLWKSDNLRQMTRLGRKERAALAEEFFPNRTYVRKEDVDKVERGIASGRIKPPASLGAGRLGRTRALNVLRGFKGEKPKRVG